MMIPTTILMSVIVFKMFIFLQSFSFHDVFASPSRVTGAFAPKIILALFLPNTRTFLWTFYKENMKFFLHCSVFCLYKALFRHCFIFKFIKEYSFKKCFCFVFHNHPHRRIWFSSANKYGECFCSRGHSVFVLQIEWCSVCSSYGFKRTIIIPPVSFWQEG